MAASLAPKYKPRQIIAADLSPILVVSETTNVIRTCVVTEVDASTKRIRFVFAAFDG